MMMHFTHRDAIAFDGGIAFLDAVAGTRAATVS